MFYSILDYIASSVETGAELLLDGRSWASEPNGFWVGPTIIKHKNLTDKALHDEIFGPVLSVVQVDTWQEAIEIENNNPYGNAACIYTEKGANAEWFINRFRAAMLGVNIGIPVPRGISYRVILVVSKIMNASCYHRAFLIRWTVRHFKQVRRL